MSARVKPSNNVYECSVTGEAKSNNCLRSARPGELAHEESGAIIKDKRGEPLYDLYVLTPRDDEAPLTVVCVRCRGYMIARIQNARKQGKEVPFFNTKPLHTVLEEREERARRRATFEESEAKSLEAVISFLKKHEVTSAPTPTDLAPQEAVIGAGNGSDEAAGK